MTPRIAVSDPVGLAAFVRRVFGATGEDQKDRPTVLKIGDSRIMIGDASVRARSTAFLYVYVADVDAAFRRALDAGARSVEEPSSQPYGDRRAMVEDPGATRGRSPHMKESFVAPGREPVGDMLPSATQRIE